MLGLMESSMLIGEPWGQTLFLVFVTWRSWRISGYEMLSS